MNPENQIDKSIDDLLARIEQECNEEPDTLLTVHPENYTTEHLFELRGRWLMRHRNFLKFSSVVFSLGAASAIFFALGMLGFWYSPLWGVFFLPLSIGAFVSFMIGVIWLNIKFKSSGYQEAILHVLDSELKRRGQFVE